MVPSDVSAAIPRLRDDLEMIPIEENGSRFIVLRDPAGYSSEMIAMTLEAWQTAAIFDGRLTAPDIRRLMMRIAGIDLPAEEITGIAVFLDERLCLDNAGFRDFRRRRDEEFASSTIRKAVYAGQSYPDEPSELNAFLSELFQRGEAMSAPDGPVGVIAPHIDLQVGASIYVPAYQLLRTAEFDTVAIIGTNHRPCGSLFVPTEKDFETPLGIAETDKDFMRILRESSGNAVSADDLHHRNEHTIEFQILFLQHAFGNRRIRVAPVLCSSFDHLFADGKTPAGDPEFRSFISAFREAEHRTGRRIAYILSVDWSHVGRKFHDEQPASELLPSAKESDRSHFTALENADLGLFHRLVMSTGNRTNIDGLSCITTFFELTRPSSGRLLAYEQWHEVERESGVTYASMAFYR